MATLNLFPARVRFVNDDGTLTPEAYRTLQVLFARVGGPLGDNGSDVFSQLGLGQQDTRQDDLVAQSATESELTDMLQQPAGVDAFSPDVVQPVNDHNGVFTTLVVSGNASIGDTLKLSAGTVGLPSLYWSTNTTTGFYRIGANNNGYAVAGVKVLDLLATGLAVTGALSATGTANFGIVAGATGIVSVGDNGSGNSGVRLFGSSTQRGWQVGSNITIANALEFTPATVAGGTTFTTPVVVINTAGLFVTGVQSVTGAAGINGKNPVANVTAPTAAGATYTATEQTLLNDIRLRLINFGIYT